MDKLENMDKIRQYGQNRTTLTKSDNMDKIGQN